MASIPPDPTNPDKPDTFPGSDNPPPPMTQPGDPGDAPNDMPTPTQA